MKRFESEFVMCGRVWEARVLSLDPARIDAPDSVGPLISVRVREPHWKGPDHRQDTFWWECGLWEDHAAVRELLGRLGLVERDADSAGAELAWMLDRAHAAYDARRGSARDPHLVFDGVTPGRRRPVAFVRAFNNYLCGYVALPPRHPLHGVRYADIDWEAFELTYSAPAGEDLLHLETSAVPVLGRLADIGDGWWVLGFGDIGCTAVGNDAITSLARRLHRECGRYRTGRGGCGLHVTPRNDDGADDPDDGYDPLCD